MLIPTSGLSLQLILIRDDFSRLIFMTCDTLMDFISSMTVVLSNIYYGLGSVSIEKSTVLLTGLFVYTFRRRRKLYQYSW